MDFLINIDNAVLHFINTTCKNPFLDMVMPYITELGGSRFVFLLAVVLFVFGRKKIRMTSVLILAGQTISFRVIGYLKFITARPRPFDALNNVYVLVSSGNYAFPSGHTATAFMCYFIMAKCFGMKYLFYTIAVLVGISRIYNGVHYPSDVAVGALFGTGFGYIVCWAAEKAGIYDVSG